SAQFTPAPAVANFRCRANRIDNRTAAGVGSGNGLLSQIVALCAGPSISGGGAGRAFGTKKTRSCCLFARPPGGGVAAAMFLTAVWLDDDVAAEVELDPRAGVM